MNIAFAGSGAVDKLVFRKPRKNVQLGAEKDVMEMIFAIKTHFQLFNIEAI